jgi:hypothetical protein
MQRRTFPSVKAAASSSAAVAEENFSNFFSFSKLHTPAALRVSSSKSPRLSSFLSLALKTA